MCIRLIAIHGHDRPLAIGALNRIGSHQDVPGLVPQIDRARKYLVLLRTLLHPLQVDELAGKVLRGVIADVKVFIGYEISVGTPSAAAAAQRFGLNRRTVEDIAP